MSAPQQTKKATGWGSLLLSGLESRLDSILADDETKAAEDAARKAKGEAASKPAALKAESQNASRSQSRNRANDRLHDRLAKAVGKGADSARSSRPSSDIPSRTASPALPRESTDSRISDVHQEPSIAGAVTADTPDIEARKSEDGASKAANDVVEATTNTRTSTSVPAIDLPSTPSARPSVESTRPSIDSLPPPNFATRSAQPPLQRSPSFLESELSRVTEVQDEVNRNYQEELHAHLERIDALQAKLTYLAGQVSSAARASATAAASGSLEKKVAEQDQMIVQLMEEGQKLSKTEMKHLGTIKKLRIRMQEEDKQSVDLKRRLEKAEQEREEHKERARLAEDRDKAAQERLKALPKLRQDMALLKGDKDSLLRDISELKRQIANTERRAEEAETRAQTDKVEEQIRVVAELNDELSNVRIEKRLIEDRAKAEVKQIREDTAQQQEKTQLAELELRSEVQNLETKLELLRSRSEEVTSNTSNDAQAKLLRQVETLQTQYALASENWQALESTLNSRVMALEKERDDISKREADVRKKAREVKSKARRLEEDLETEKDKASTMESELAQQKASLAKLQTRHSAAETALAEARAEAEREKKVFEKELQVKLDEEKTKWKQENSHPTPPMEANQFLRTESPTTYFTQRKSSSDLRGLQSRRSNAGSRVASDLPPLFTENSRPPSRRTSTVPWHTARTPTMEPGTPGRQDSTASAHYSNGTMPPSASISVAPSLDALDDHMDKDSTSSPHRTVNELISVSAVGAGPSVQLVERMSAAVRRLESEKADSKEEMARILAQRDEAREEVVSLMREVEAARGDKERMTQLEEEVKSIKGRYDAALELLGEKSEECEELKNDVLDLKKIYRELVESTMK